MDLGPHAGFIVAAYAVTLAVLAILILRAVVDHRTQLRALAELESRGVRRRSQTSRPAAVQASAVEAPAGGPNG